jgi:hypothetical protein
MEVRKPLLVKIAPDLTEQDKVDIAAVVTSRKVLQELSSFQHIAIVWAIIKWWANAYFFCSIIISTFSLSSFKALELKHFEEF